MSEEGKALRRRLSGTKTPELKASALALAVDGKRKRLDYLRGALEDLKRNVVGGRRLAAILSEPEVVVPEEDEDEDVMELREVVEALRDERAMLRAKAQAVERDARRDADELETIRKKLTKAAERRKAKLGKDDQDAPWAKAAARHRDAEARRLATRDGREDLQADIENLRRHRDDLRATLHDKRQALQDQLPTEINAREHYRTLCQDARAQKLPATAYDLSTALRYARIRHHSTNAKQALIKQRQTDQDPREKLSFLLLNDDDGRRRQRREEEEEEEEGTSS